MYKKIFIFVLPLILAGSSLCATQVADYEVAKAKIENIMAHEETGIAAYNKKNIHCAETKSLACDLNVKAIALFFDCKTVVGNAFIAEILKQPVSPQDRDTILLNRQNIIKFLVNDPAFKVEITQLLDEARVAEQESIILLSDFFKGKTCPELKQLELIRQQNPLLAPAIEVFMVNQTAKTVSTAWNLFTAGVGLGTLGFAAPFVVNAIRMGNCSRKVGFFVAYLALGTGINVYSLGKDYALASEKRVKMHALSSLVAIAEKFELLCVKHGLKNQFKISNIQDQQGADLVARLKHSRYQKKSCWLFSTPAVHTFLYKIYQQEKYFAEVFASIAEMDAYNAIATKIIASQGTNNQMCFVSFLDNEKPSITIKGFWNVLVKGAVANDIVEQRHIILTGPNAGGKTTSIRAILQNIIIGQSFGVAAAQVCEFTMFDMIYSYLNISDDLVNGLSLFASEVKRAQEIIESIKTLAPQKKFFFALDELFTGTAAAEGEICAYNFIQRIAVSEGVQFVYATHFNKLKELEFDNNQRCMNYQVGAPIKNEQGKLVYPFTFYQGASDSCVALDMAKEANLFA